MQAYTQKQTFVSTCKHIDIQCIQDIHAPTETDIQKHMLTNIHTRKRATSEKTYEHTYKRTCAAHSHKICC